MGRVRILMIGTLPPPMGGAGVSLKHLVDALAQRDDVELLMVNTSGVRGHAVLGPIRFIHILWRIFALTRRCEVVSLQAAPTGLPLVGPFVYVFAKLWGRPLMVRKFGGKDYLAFAGIRGFLARRVVRASELYLAQTKELVRSGEQDGLKRVEWFPTSRPMEQDVAQPSRKNRSCRRFVFLSLVRPTKGIRELIEAAERLGEDITVDVYGPFFEGFSEQNLAGLKRVKYRGVVASGEANSVLRNYDTLVLPTYWEGEGYPGIIIEAFGAGIAVISTRWKAIPEIVDESCGILVKPRDVDELYDAMKTLVDDDGLYSRLCEGARSKAKLFDAQVWTDRFVSYCKDLANAKREAPSRSV